MIRLARFAKPYLAMLAVAVALLFVQAYANLALPDYMAKIVNVGIQQGGVTGSVPLAVRKLQMDRLLSRMSGPDSARVLSDFRLLQPGTATPAEIKRFPALVREPVYVSGSMSAGEKSALEPVFRRAWLSAGGDGTPPQLQNQAAIAAVRGEYSALGMDLARIQSGYMLGIGAIMLLFTLLAAFTAIATGFISARIASGMARDLRAAVFERVESFSAGEFDRFSTASLITRSTNDIMQIQMVAVMLVTMVFYAPIIGVGGIIRAVGKSSSMWWIIAIAVAILLTVVLTIFSVAVPKFKLMQRLMDRLNLVSRETLSGMMVIRAFNMQPHEERRFDDANSDLTGTMLFVNRVMVIMQPFMILIMNGLSLLIIWVGSRQVAASTMQVGDMMAFMQYAMQIVFAFLMLSMMFIMLPRASVSAGRVADVLATEPIIMDPAAPAACDAQLAGTVEFRNVSFRYPGAEVDVLHDISFTARPGETTAFIGATGSGKSTLVNLIPRFYDVGEGAVLVGGRDVRAVSQHDLRDEIGYVPQKAVLFSGTIESNLRYADEEASERVLETAAAVSQSREFIEAFPEGMNSRISQGGTNVSGGQKQRLSIARAIVKNPPLYIFDDSLSALDFKTDADLRRALRAQTATSSVLIVTQRVSTIKNADQIIVLDEGRIVGRGTHRELLSSCETYREIASSQLSREELG